MLGWPVLLVSVWLVCANGASRFDNDSTQRWSDYMSNVLGKSVTKFTLDMDKAIDRFRTKAIRNRDTSNIILSPLNLVNTLLVIHLGALGKTFEEIADVLGLRNELFIKWKSELIHQIFGRLIENVSAHLVNSSDTLLNTSTTVFSQADHPMRPEFKAVSRKIYKALITELDLNSHPDETTDQINRWLDERMLPGMGGYILPRLISINSDAIIASSLNFIGKRRKVFSKSMMKVPFMITPNESVLVDTIYVEGDGSFYRDKELDLEIIGLPYVPFPVVFVNGEYVRNRSTSMYILRPLSKDPGSLIHMKRRLTPKIIEDLLGKLMYMYIQSHIPCMNLSSTLNLKRELVSMGLSSLFDRLESNLGVLSENFQHFSDNPDDLMFPSWNYMKLQRDMNPNQLFPQLGFDELKANLSRSKKLKNPGIFMSHFIHKVNLVLNETQTIACSSTVAARLSGPDDESDSDDLHNDSGRAVSGIYDPSWKGYFIMDVIIDRPFLFFIKHDPTNLMLFWGTVNNPKSS